MESEQSDLNVLQTKEIPGDKPGIPEPENSYHSDHSDLPLDDIPIPEEKDTDCDLDMTEVHSVDPDQDIDMDVPSMSKTPEHVLPDEIVLEPATYLEKFKAIIENQPKIQLKRLSGKDLPKKLAKHLKKINHPNQVGRLIFS